MVDHQDWLDRWRENRIGFHENGVNRHLQKFFPRVAPGRGGRVFLPLCGKALDIRWIAQQGYEVIGVELSGIALEAFFAENEIDFERRETGRFVSYRAPAITLLQGDFFDLEAADLAGCRLVYDRAALIALERDDRRRYCEHMLSIVPADCDMLLVTFEYDQQAMQGPPFSVPAGEVRQYYGDAFDLELLHSEDIVDERPRWREAGLARLQESVFRMTRR